MCGIFMNFSRGTGRNLRGGGDRPKRKSGKIQAGSGKIISQAVQKACAADAHAFYFVVKCLSFVFIIYIFADFLPNQC